MRKYLMDGREVEVVKEIEGGYLVRLVLLYDGMEYEDEDILFFESGSVFDTPLAVTAKYSEKIQSMEKQLKELEIKIKKCSIGEQGDKNA